MKNWIKIIFVIGCYFYFVISFANIIVDDKDIIGVITAISSESKPLIALMQNKKNIVIDNVKYIDGEISGRRVVLAVSGIGKINAANITSRFIRDFHPKYIIFAGIAGAINANLNIGYIVVGDKIYNVEHFSHNEVINNDKVNVINNKLTPLYLNADQKLLAVSKIKNNKDNGLFVIHGIIATTDIFPPTSSQINELLSKKIDAIDMEGFAFMQVCWLYETSCLVVRGISDYSTTALKDNYEPKKYNITLDGKSHAENNVAVFVKNIIASI